MERNGWNWEVIRAELKEILKKRFRKGAKVSLVVPGWPLLWRGETKINTRKIGVIDEGASTKVINLVNETNWINWKPINRVD